MKRRGHGERVCSLIRPRAQTHASLGNTQDTNPSLRDEERLASHDSSLSARKRHDLGGTTVRGRPGRCGWSGQEVMSYETKALFHGQWNKKANCRLRWKEWHLQKLNITGIRYVWTYFEKFWKMSIKKKSYCIKKDLITWASKNVITNFTVENK